MSDTLLVANPKLGYLAHKKEYDTAYKRVLDSGWYILGKEVEAFEHAFAAFCGAKHAIGVATGTDAITLMLVAAGIGQGDEVITTPLTAAFGVLAIERAGATAVFVDIDPVTFCLDPKKITAALTPKTKAILPVHLYGQPADIQGIQRALKTAGRTDVLVFEDACQAHGAKIGANRVGSFGLASAFSFYPTKNLGAFGDGGLITTNNNTLAAKIRILRDGGQTSKYHHELSGYNSRLDELQAAFLSVRLQYLDADNARRGAIATQYLQAFKNLSFIELPTIAKGNTSVWHLFVVKSPKRDALQNHLKAVGIQSAIHYPMGVHQQPFMDDGAAAMAALPNTEQAAQQILSLPMYPEMTDTNVRRVIAAVQSFKAK